MRLLASQEKVCVLVSEAINVNLFLPMKLVLLSKTSYIPSCVAESESGAAKALQQNVWICGNMR